MKKIYPKQWLQYHPYTTIDAVDRYYCNLANKLLRIINEHKISLADPELNETIYEETAVFLAGWFEDVISQTGMWQTFTSECEKRYGSRLPFFELDNEYYSDEINLEDVRFILWHCAQDMMMGECIYNPETQEFKKLAEAIYDLLSKEYETAPENERLQEFFDFSQLTENDFLDYRNKVEWFFMNAYINTGCYENYLDSLKEEMEELEKKDNLDMETFSMRLYSHKAASVLLERTPLLAITAPEFIRLIQENRQADPNAPYMNIKAVKNSFYSVESETDTYFVLKNLLGDNTCYNVTKASLNMKSANFILGKSIVTSTLFKYGEYWFHNGAMEQYNIDQIPQIKEDLKKLEEITAMRVEEKIYQLFMKATKGKHFVFCKGESELSQFVEKKLKLDFNGQKDLTSQLSNVNDDVIIVTVTPKRGIYLMVNSCQCVASPDNPYYDQKEAEEKALFLLTAKDTVPYEIVCDLCDHGYLKDAKFNSTLGVDRGKEIVRNNAQFIVDYFYKRCREKDCN